jgi:type IV pilus assembly protein PilF
MMEPTAELVWLVLRIERKLGNREAEARYASQLRRRFPGSPEQRLMNQGQYD